MARKDSNKRIYEEQMLEARKSLSEMQVNTPEQIDRAHYYYERYLMQRGDMEQKLKESERIHGVYECIRDDYNTSDQYAPKSFCPILQPIIEGMVASMIEYNMTTNVMPAGPTDANYAKTLNYGQSFIERNNAFKQYAKDFTRLYLLDGNAVLTFWWDDKAYGGIGIPRLRIVPFTKFFQDGRLKDSKDLQFGEYCIEEIGFQSIAWAKKEYGDEIADAIVRMNNNYQYGKNQKRDDIDSFTLLHVWTRNNPEGNLQLIEMTTNPMILRESDPSKPYYPNGDNLYPFAFAREYLQLFDFHGYGDGRMLEPIQRTVNKLFDEIEIACRFQAQTRVFVDPAAQMDADQMDSDPSHEILARNPNATIRFVEGRGINPVVMNTIQLLIQQAERAARFSGTMSGLETNNAVSATQSGIMLQQGNTTIADKKSDLAAAFEFIIKYCLKVALDNWDRGFWARVGKNDSFEYIDFSQVREVPAAMPSTFAFKDEWSKNNPEGIPPPNYQLVENGDETVKKSIDFDVKVALGDGLPNNKVAIHNVLLNLFQLQVIDVDTFKKLTEQYLGLDLGTAEEDEAKSMAANATPMLPTSVNPASATTVAPVMGTQAPSATGNMDMAETVPGGMVMPNRSAGVI